MIGTIALAGLFGGSAFGVELAAVFLIFTSMFWNLAFGVYESLITVPEELNAMGRGRSESKA